MAVLSWDDIGLHIYETGVDHGVLYLPDSFGAYIDGVSWNGLVTVTESPTGAEPNAKYADNIKYLSLLSAEEFGATIEAYTYPDEFAQFDGLGVPSPGLTVGQQARKTFGLCYRTKVGNDLEGEDFGFKLHLVYGLTASPSEKAYSSINDSPEAITFSWKVTSVPAPVTGMRPTSVITVDSVTADEDGLTVLMNALYGGVGTDPRLPTPDEVLAMFAGTLTLATPTVPGFATNVITIPTVTGVTYYIGGAAQTPGVKPAITVDTLVTARPNAGYYFPSPVDDEWLFKHT